MKDRRNIFWATALSLVLTLFVSVALSRVVDDHFRSWTNWPGVEVESSFGRLARSMVDVLSIAVIPTTLAAGGFLGWRALHGRAKPYAFSLAAAALSGLLSELTSFVGQDATRDEVQKVSLLSIAVFLVVFFQPLATVLFSLWPVKEDSPRNVEPLPSS